MRGEPETKPTPEAELLPKIWGLDAALYEALKGKETNKIVEKIRKAIAEFVKKYCQEPNAPQTSSKAS